jgi:hypothetical protein
MEGISGELEVLTSAANRAHCRVTGSERICGVAYWTICRVGIRTIYHGGHHKIREFLSACLFTCRYLELTVIEQFFVVVTTV